VTAVDLRLKIGDILQLQPVPSERSTRYAVRLIGFLPGKSLVVTTPESKGGVMLVREGQRYAARMLLGGCVFGFVASVLRSCAQPYPYMHLSYPTEVESIVVRNARRVDINVPVKAHNCKNASDNTSWLKARLTDLSSTGARLISSKSLGNVGDRLGVAMHLKVQGAEEGLNLIAVVRNEAVIEPESREDIPEYRYGLEFQSVNRFQQLIIHGFVLEYLVSDAAPN